MPTSITSSGITFDDATTLTTGVVPTANIADSAVTPVKLSQPYTLSAAKASTSGPSIDFTGIPSWAKRITVMFNGVSTNGTSVVQIQLGSGTYQTSGYASASFRTNGTAISNTGSSTGLVSDFANTAGDVRNGAVSIVNITSNTWVSYGALGNNNGQMGVGTGTVSLAGTLDRIRVTTVNGTDTFDAGTINISYEG